MRILGYVSELKATNAGQECKGTKEQAIEDDWIARQSRILEIMRAHELIFKAICPGFRRLARYDTLLILDNKGRHENTLL